MQTYLKFAALQNSATTTFRTTADRQRLAYIVKNNCKKTSQKIWQTEISDISLHSQKRTTGEVGEWLKPTVC